jgi:hypothetical protein
VLEVGGRETPELRARLLECDCGLPGCSTVFVVVQQPGAHEALWLGMGVVVSGRDDAAAAMDELLDDPGRVVGFRTVSQMVERGLALVGLGWEAVRDRGVLEAQIRAWALLPEWMERQPAGYLWRTRGLVFGRELSRVPRALWGVARAYVPEGPEGYDDFEQDGRWGIEHTPHGIFLYMSVDAPVSVEDLLRPTDA